MAFEEVDFNIPGPLPIEDGFVEGYRPDQFPDEVDLRQAAATVLHLAQTHVIIRGHLPIDSQPETVKSMLRDMVDSSRTLSEANHPATHIVGPHGLVKDGVVSMLRGGVAVWDEKPQPKLETE